MKYLLHLYKKYLSPILGSILGFSNNTCRFYPTCSDYMGQAIKKYGYLKGTYKGITRILRCNQFFKGGIDYP